MADDTSPSIPNPQDPKKSAHRWLDLTVALSALLVSVVSIFVGYASNQSMERVARAGAWPFVQLGSGNASNDGRQELAFGVTNVGTGPARVYTFQMEVDGRPLPEGHLLTNLLRACCDRAFSAAIARTGSRAAAMGFELSTPVARRFLASSTEVDAERWPRSEQNAAIWDALDHARQAGRIAMSACYCSVFEECWYARSNSFPPQQIRSCSAEDLQHAQRPTP